MLHDARRALLLSLLVASPALAGCMGGDTAGDGLAYSSFQDAMDAPGKVYEPTNTDSPVRLKLLQPADPSSVAEGNLSVTLLLYDAETKEPVTDASFVLEARMPSMGHGTSPEGDPTHLKHGVYEGYTTISMPGGWILNLDPQLADGTVLEFDVDLQAGGGDGGTHHHGPDTSPRYDTFNEALNAEGDTYQPDDATGNWSLRLKLLDPAHPDEAEKGKRALMLLLYDAEAGQPVTDGSLDLESWMPMMGHGTHGEEDPVHKDHGEWAGVTNFTMNGSWEVNLTLALPADGTQDTYRWQVDVQVGEGDMQMGSES